ncbi:MAG: DUF6756 family protein [Gemmataceae bacterium]
MWTAVSEIARVLTSSESLAARVRVVDPDEAEDLLQRVRERYLGGRDPLFWWEHLPPDVEGYNPPDGDAPRLLPLLAPTPDEPAWLIVGLDDRRQGVYECPPTVIPELLGECAYFEYAVIGKDLSWLLLENHHGCLFASGTTATRLSELNSHQD